MSQTETQETTDRDEVLTQAFLADLRDGADPVAVAKAIFQPATIRAFEEALRRFRAEAPR